MKQRSSIDTPQLFFPGRHGWAIDPKQHHTSTLQQKEENGRQRAWYRVTHTFWRLVRLRCYDKSTSHIQHRPPAPHINTRTFRRHGVLRNRVVDPIQLSPYTYRWSHESATLSAVDTVMTCLAVVQAEAPSKQNNDNILFRFITFSTFYSIFYSYRANTNT